jgi:hypothetical protein
MHHKEIKKKQSAQSKAAHTKAAANCQLLTRRTLVLNGKWMRVGAKIVVPKG